MQITVGADAVGQHGGMDEPFVPEGRVLPLPGLGDTFVRVHLVGGDRPTLLLLHGWTMTADLNWFACYGPLAARYNLVAIDHRGHGRGLRTPRPFALAAAADDAVAALDALGIDTVVAVGYSMGGPIALHLVDRHPERVEGLVLSATAGRFDARLRQRLVWLLYPLLQAAMRLDGGRHLLTRLVERRSASDPLVAMWRPRLLGELKHGTVSDELAAGRALARADVLEEAELVDVPAAMVLTTKDVLVPVATQRELASVVDATMLELDADHSAFLLDAAAFASTITAAIDGVVARRRHGGRPRRQQGRHRRRRRLGWPRRVA